MLRKDDGRIKLCNRFDDGGKNKHDQEAEPRFVELVQRQVGEFCSAVVVPAEDVTRAPHLSGQLTSSQRTVLEVLEAYDQPISAKEIHTASRLSQSTAYRVLQELEESAYIVKLRNPATYQITDAGRTAFYES